MTVSLKSIYVALAVLAISFAAIGARAEERDYFIATASSGGTFYPVGVALATLTKLKLKSSLGIGMEAINSAGSEENIHLLRENQAQFAILQGLFGRYAWRGEGPIAEAGPQKSLRAVTMLWQNVEQFSLHAKYAKTGTVEDLRSVIGMAMALGKKNSGTLVSNRVLLANLGIDIEADYQLVYVGYGPSAESLQRGSVVGMGTPAGLPTGSVARVKAAMGDEVRILSFTPDHARAADGGFDLWTRFTIPANTYPNQEQEIETIAQPNFLAVRADVDDEAVYQIIKAVYENLPFLHSMHEATKAMVLEKALTGLPMPLHSGALRYYREAGLEIPAHLVPQ